MLQFALLPRFHVRGQRNRIRFPLNLVYLPMSLNNADKKQYRSIGHNLKPIVTIAQKGITDNIRQEIDRALKDHELIKLKLVTADRDEKKALTDAICAEMKAECIQSIGHVILLYRAAKNPDKRLSNVSRAIK